MYLAIATTLSAQSSLNWEKSVGAKTFPYEGNIIKVNDWGAVNNGLILSTEAIQKAIDTCAMLGGGKVIFDEGTYLTGAVFIKSNVNLEISENVEIRGVIGLEEYPIIDTRVAGIEMKWPAAIFNIIDQNNAALTGNGTIHAQGRYHWERYWKLREEYTPLGLRWASDYDCKRVRTVLVSNSNNITISNLTMKQAGFWTVHLLYSENVTVDGIIINNNIDGHGPSTDGIDIDSSSRILIENCDIDCNDDNFCFKSGRDADGLRVNRPTEYVVIKNCISRNGGGLVSFGSETSGGINNILVYNLKAYGTRTAIRLKSALTRGGGISNIEIRDIEMYDVFLPVEVTLNWNPAYSYASIGESDSEIPDYWKVMLEEVDPREGIPVFKNVNIKNITAKNAKTAMYIAGNANSYIENFKWENIHITSDKPGEIAYTKNWSFNNVKIKSKDGLKVKMENNINFTTLAK